MTIGDSPPTAPIPRRKLFHEVADRVMARILNGELSPGDQLPSERELMRLYGVGRPAVREAMQTLERMGLIVISHGERAKVAAPSARSIIDQIAQGARHFLNADPEHLEHLKSARLFFEEGMVRQAVENVTDDFVDDLRGLIREQEATASNTAFLDCDMRFHRRIAAMTGNPIYPALLQAMFEWLAEYHIEMVSVAGAENLTISEHARIVDEIAAGNSEGAATAMRDHLLRANALYRQYGA